MKILITTGIFPPDIGGPATYVNKISEEFAKMGHGIRVITYSDAHQDDSKKSFNIYRVIRGKSSIWRYAKYFFQVFIRAGWADVIYLQDTVSAGLPTVLANFVWRKKLVLKVVGDFAWEQGQNQYGLRDDLDAFQHQEYDFKIEVLRKIEHWVARCADVVITPSEYLKKIVRCWGMKEGNVRVIYNAFEEPDFIDESVKMPEGDVIFTAGRLVAWKGMDTLIKIMPDLLKENPNFKLMIVGDGPERKYLENLIIELGLGGKVIMTGRLTREKLLGCLKRAKIFVLNSSYEGMSHQILEAMWLGVPVAVSRVGGNPETVAEAENGFMFVYNDKEEIKNVIKEIMLSIPFKKSCVTIEFRKKFTFEVMIKDILKVLSYVCARI